MNEDFTRCLGIGCDRATACLRFIEVNDITDNTWMIEGCPGDYELFIFKHDKNKKS